MLRFLLISLLSEILEIKKALIREQGNVLKIKAFFSISIYISIGYLLNTNRKVGCRLLLMNHKSDYYFR